MFRFVKIQRIVVLSLLLIFLTSVSIRFLFWNSEDVSVWQNLTSSTQTSFTVLVPKDEMFSYEVIDLDGNKKEVQIVGEYYKEYSNFGTQHIQVQSLTPGDSYKLIIEKKSLQEGSKNKKRFEKNFKTLDLSRDSFKIAVASCMDDRWNQKIQDRAWKNLLSHQPDMVFLIGDNVYADKYVSENPSMPEFHRRFVETVQTLHLYQNKNLVPVLAVWDDHDYGFNNGHKNFIHREEMKRLFRGFFPMYSNKNHLIKGPGISFLFKTDRQNFFFMDGRSLRDESSKGMLWGRVQENWLLAHLIRWKNPSWVINGGQFLGRHHEYESFERDFPRNFESFFKSLFQVQTPAFFVSGDRHLTELLSFGDVLPYETYELTTSGIHAVVYPPKRQALKDSRIVHHISERHNYAIVESQAEDKGLNLNIQVFSDKKNLLYSEKFKIRK